MGPLFLPRPLGADRYFKLACTPTKIKVPTAIMMLLQFNIMISQWIFNQAASCHGKLEFVDCKTKISMGTFILVGSQAKKKYPWQIQGGMGGRRGDLRKFSAL